LCFIKIIPLGSYHRSGFADYLNPMTVVIVEAMRKNDQIPSSKYISAELGVTCL
jgi:hypothetical protein